MKAEYGNWNESKWQPVREGIDRVVLGLTAETMSCTVAECKSGNEVKPHSHPNEQIAIILQGTCDYYVDGTPYAMKPGSWIVVPANVEHYIHVYDSKEPVLNLDIFAPNRPEYTESFKKFLSQQE
ncbi:cupin domain-containing protein [Clostridium malenominatum]|uniref:Cupin domain-containing protein n=1 Tax=Clostridium malenominatum TaxID=1539 RepID=A0ABP3U1C5_9CLOT